MMKTRPIYFRGWESITKQMLLPFDLEWLKVNTPAPGDFNKKALFDDNLIFMQFTGLLDKKGKEIYESDILAIPSFQNQQVIWDEARAAWMIDGHGYPTGQLNHFSKEALVIGNIYQNGDLLK